MDDRRPRRRDGYLLERLDDELLIYHVVQETVVNCNETAGLIWGMSDGTRTVDEMIALLVACYPDAAAQIGGEVLVVVDQLVAAGLLELC